MEFKLKGGRFDATNELRRGLKNKQILLRFKNIKIKKNKYTGNERLTNYKEQT